MKNFTFKLLFFCVILSDFSGFSQCGSGTVTLDSQQAVDDFVTNYSGCSLFTGNLQISGSDITDLTPLAQLTSVTGNLRLWGNASLTSLQGLHNITSIGGNLELDGFNFPLVNLDGLAGLESVDGMLSVQSFQNITSIQGLSNLTTVGGNFLIQYLGNTDFTSISLPNLTSVARFDLRENNNLITVDFNGLETVGTTFHLHSNDNLETANFPALEEVGANLLGDFQINSGKFEVYQGINLENVDFSSLHTVKGGIDFIENNLLQDLGFQNLTTVLRAIRINVNPALTSIDGLSGLSGTLTNLSIIGTNISNLDALENITAIGIGTTGDLIINDNPLLNDVTGLSEIATINRNLEIHNNDALENLNGLNAVSSINYGYLSIQDNAVLEEMNGLQNLASVGLSGNAEGILIINNTALEHLDGLASLASLKGSFTLRNNTSLQDVSAINITSAIFGFSNNIIIENNDALPNLDGFFIEKVNGQFQILGNDSLQAIDLEIGVASTVLSLLIDNNSLLTDISGLQNITQATNGFRVINNDSLQNLDGLGLTSITSSYLMIKDNQLLNNIDGLISLTNAINNVSLEVMNNATLTNLDGLKNLTKAGRILIQNNPLLENINGLSGITLLNMTSDTRLLSIFNNQNLESIQGVRNINQTTILNLLISTNPKVEVCDLKNICDYLATAKPRTINTNASGCNNVTEIQSSCPTIWNGTAWSDGEPNASRSAIIEGNLELTTSLSAKNFTVNSGIFSILPEASLSIDGSIINNLEPANFIVENDGNLVQTTTASTRKNQGEIIVYKENTPFKRLDYTMWSSPISNQNLFGFSPETINGVTNYIGATGRIYVYEGTSGYINPSPFTADAVFANAKGYLFRAPNTWDEVTPIAYEGEFIGTPNNGSLIVSTYEDSFTSIGNPYPSTIDALELFDANPSLGALYFWTNTYAAEDGDYTQNNYATYTIAGGTAVNEEGVEPTNHIAVGQGFIAYNDTTQVTFTNAMRVNNTTNFFRTNTAERHRFWLNLKGENDVNYNQILVSYMDGATDGVDTQIDGKMFGYEGSALYSLIEDEKYSIQGKGLPFEVSDVVPLGFKAENMGTFTISLANFDGLFLEGDVIIHLKDNQTNMTHNLQTPYSFLSDAGTFNERFEVVYQSTLGIENPDTTSRLFIYKFQENIIVKSDEEIQKIKIYDVLGRLIYSNEKVNTTIFQIPSNLINAEMLLISVESNNRITTRKIIN
ncbi:T9SS type A sorting domain-containing protein [Flavobacterium soli]|uniref:T9SS type A sorting domain-containing protein n=1 Tax=Flavobacterium soli TaxID=344881 RepID=UPI0003FF5A2E|nr:T9SS type A sorting domain-containing protein [Flavobacterium soli]